MKNWLKVLGYGVLLMIVGGGTYFGMKALSEAAWAGHVWVEWSWAVVLFAVTLAVLTRPDQRRLLVGPKGARGKNLLKVLGYGVLLMIVGGGASLGVEALVGAAWAGWLAGAVALCGVLALMFKLEKNGLLAEAQPAGKVGDEDGRPIGA